MYEIFVKHHFSSAHKLIGYKGACSNLHGHNWKITVYARTNDLNNIGISLDFNEFKKKAKEEIDKFDHTYLNDCPDFEGINPTAENISRILFEKISLVLNNDQLKIYCVEIWESDNQGARYYGDNLK